MRRRACPRDIRGCLDGRASAATGGGARGGCAATVRNDERLARAGHAACTRRAAITGAGEIIVTDSTKSHRRRAPHATRTTLALAALGLVAAGAGRAAAVQVPPPGAVSPSTLKLPDGPASVRGLADTPSFSPFSGQVSYEVPIELPAGPAGFRPSLALVYSGALGNGPVGIGWAVTAPSIRRSERLGVP